MSKKPISYPTPWQRKILWRAISLAALVAIGAMGVGLVLLGTRLLGELQPVLIPVAVAGILAYLLDPVVRRAQGWLRLARTHAILLVFAVLVIAVAVAGFRVIPNLSSQVYRFGERLPALAQKARDRAATELEKIQTHIDSEPSLQAAEEWVRESAPSWGAAVWAFFQRSLGGTFGTLGFLLGFLLTPVYLFYFLINSEAIEHNWASYLPLRASGFKDEVVAVISEINGYLINFFRGQVLVSMIDGLLTGFLLLVVVRLDYAILLGVLVAVLGVIPYLGILLSWIPAVIIAATQFNDWGHPLMVTVIFLVVQNVDGMFIAPKIVGESVGLHPMTVIFSVVFWSLLIGGLLGSLLAVPLTATVKVLLSRYVWLRGSSETPKRPPDILDDPPPDPILSNQSSGHPT